MGRLYVVCKKVGQVSSIGLFIIFLFLQTSYAATFYFSSSTGNDEYSHFQAQHPATPWRSLDKLNSFSHMFVAGDTILFKRSDVFFGSIKIATSGSPFAPIYFGAYGKGAKPEISALTTLTEWKSAGNGIYETDCEGDNNLNTLIINGNQIAMGRYPNKGYLTLESHCNNTSITDNQLTDLTNWTGGEVVIRKNRWTIDKSLITNHSGCTISYAQGTTTAPTNGYGYFIQNDIQTLDRLGEWFFNAERKKMAVFFGKEQPSSYTVKTSAIKTLVSIKGFNNITFADLSFVGAGVNAFHLVNSRNINIVRCTIDFSGNEAILVSYSPNLTIENTSIDHSLSGGINLDAGCTYASILKNTIKNTGLIAGSGRSGTGTYEGITSFGDYTRIERNEIENTGYNAIYFGGNSSYVKNNLIKGFCLTKDDGAGIYVGDWSKTYDKKIIENIVLNGVGVGEGTNNIHGRFAEGIYIDDNSESVTISGNTVSLCSNNGIKIHNAKNINVVNNIVYNNAVQLRLEQDGYLATSSAVRENNIRNNIFYSNNNQQLGTKLSSHQDDIDSFGMLESNFNNNTCNSIKTKQPTKSVVKSRDGIFVHSTSCDFGSGKLSTEIIFEYNASPEARTLTLKKEYSDVQDNIYKGKVIIQPYSSVILIGTNGKSNELAFTKAGANN